MKKLETFEMSVISGGLSFSRSTRWSLTGASCALGGFAGYSLFAAAALGGPLTLGLYAGAIAVGAAIGGCIGGATL